MKNDIPNIPSHFHIYNMNFVTLSWNFITRFPWYFKINLGRRFLEANFLARKKCIFLNMPAKLVLRIRNFVKMQGNLWKISCSLPTFLKILVFHNFFQIFWQLYFKNINFLTKTKKCLLCWLLWIQNYQMTGKYLTSNTTFFKKVNPKKYQIQTYIGEDLEFIIHEFYWCIQLDHKIY